MSDPKKVLAINPLQRFFAGEIIEQRHEFRYTSLAKQPEPAKSVRGDRMVLIVYAVFVELVTAALLFGKSGHFNGGLVFLAILLNAKLVFVLYQLMVTKKQIQEVRANIEDHLILQDGKLWVRRGGALLPAVAITQLKAGVGSDHKSRLNKTRVSLDVAGSELWYDPSSMEEVPNLDVGIVS